METGVGRTDGAAPIATDTSRAARLVLLGVAGVHLVYPLGAAATLALWPGSAGDAYASAALLVLPVMFLVMALVVGPMVWRAWHGGQLAPWVLAAFVSVEAWLYWNGSRTPSWAEPDASDRFALTMFAMHALAALAALAVAVTLVLGRVGSRARDDS